MAIRNINLLHENMAELSVVFEGVYQRISEIRASYDAMRRETNETFYASRQYWEDKVRNDLKNANGLSNEKKTKMRDMISGLERLEEQLCRVDKSYAKRKNGEFSSLNPSCFTSYDNSTDLFAKFNEIHDEAIRIAKECSLTIKSQAVQEIGMLFSGKRKAMYERLYLLMAEANNLKAVIEEEMDLRVSNIEENLVVKKDYEIQKALEETRELLLMIDEKETEEIQQAINSINYRLNSTLSEEDINSVMQLADLLGENNILPSECCEQISLGELSADLSAITQYKEAKDYINEHYREYIKDGCLEIPALFDMRNGMNFCFSSRGISGASKIVIHSIMFSMLKNQPATRQTFVLSDPEGRSKGFDPYLEFEKKYQDIMGEKILVNKDDIRNAIFKLSQYVDEVGQSKFVGYRDIFDYNRNVTDKQEPLKCLCLLDFPKYFDERMLDELYNIVNNGAEYGIQVLIDFNEDYLNDNYRESVMNIMSKIMSKCTQLEYVFGKWKFNNGVCLRFATTPDSYIMRQFMNIYDEQYEDMKNTNLPLGKIISRDKWFESSSSDNLTIPIGKNEYGEIQKLVLGEKTSHYALVIGSTGSGKSTLLHTIIMSAIASYSPDELNLYLMDFKSGTEFKVYGEKKIPHIKLLALDAMQEFGQSILDNLWEEMNRRSKLFNELISQGMNIKDIKDYRRLTRKKLPRILVVADEFQMLFSEEQNRKIANYCGGKLADFISLARVYGIHFLLATQTLSRLNSGFAIRKSTLNEMYVRIGLKCTVEESGALFGVKNGDVAFEKMGTDMGSAVYTEDYVQGKPVGFKVAYCDEMKQEEMLAEIENYYCLTESGEQTRIFTGNSVPDIKDCRSFYEVDSKEVYSSVSILLGEPIRIAPPVKLNINRVKRNNLLMVGGDQSMMDRLVALYMLSAVKTCPRRKLGIREESVYLWDGLHMIGEEYSDNIRDVVRFCSRDINVADTHAELIKSLDELYAIYEERRSDRLSGTKKDCHTIHLVINNLQWIESVNAILKNKNVSEFVGQEQQKETKVDKSNPFGYLKDKTSSTLSLMDSFLNDMNQGKQQRAVNGNVSYSMKLQTLIENGYTYGINVVLTSPDYISIKEYIYSVIPKFSNRIVFVLSNADAGRIVAEAKTEGIRDNIVIYHDGINSPYQFKPFDGIKEYVSKL